MIRRFPIAGLARDKRPAYWRGDFYEQRDGGQHSSYDTFVVKAPQATSERFKGAAIVATVDGHVPLRVSRTNTMGSGTSDRGGNFVWIEEAASPGTLHYFAHMRDTPLVQPGQQVRAGQLIGYLGDSGNARGRPHLHFSVRRPSGAVDVYDQLRAVEATAYEPPIVHGMLGIPWQRWAKVGIGASLAAGATLIAVYFLWPKPKANPRKKRTGIQEYSAPTPEGHTHFWVYVYHGKDYNFVTAVKLAEAKRELAEFMEERMPNGDYAWNEGMILWGNETEGAFTHLDPVASVDRRKS